MHDRELDVRVCCYDGSCRDATPEEMRRAIMVGLRCRDDATGKMGYLYKNEFYVPKEESK